MGFFSGQLGEAIPLEDEALPNSIIRAKNRKMTLNELSCGGNYRKERFAIRLSSMEMDSFEHLLTVI